MVMGGDSFCVGCWFEFQRWILFGHFSHLFVVNCNICLKTTVNKRNETVVGPFKKTWVHRCFFSVRVQPLDMKRDKMIAVYFA